MEVSRNIPFRDKTRSVTEQQVSEQDLIDAGQYARGQVGQIYNNCWDVASKVEMYLNDQGLPWGDDIGFEDYGVMHIRVGVEHPDAPDGGQKHYVFRLRGKYIDGPYRDDNYVWVDAAFDQFSDNSPWEFSYGPKDEIEDVRVMRVADDERISQYTVFGGAIE